MDFNFLCPKDGYLYSAEECPKAVIDVNNSDGGLRTVTLTVTASSFAHDYEKTYTVKKSIMQTVDNFEFEFPDMPVGSYKIEAELDFHGEKTVKNTSLDVVEYKGIRPSDIYNRRLKVENGKNRNFSNIDYKKSTPTPGCDYYKQYHDEHKAEKAIDKKLSPLKNSKSLRFFYENGSYAYGIAEDGKEILAFRDKDGYVDFLAGAGLLDIHDSENKPLAVNGKIADVIEGKNEVTIKYESDGEAADFTTTYIFKENYIAVKANVKYSGERTASCGSSWMRLNFINGITDKKKTYNCDWRYPYNGDYPYKYVDSWVTVNTVDDSHCAYIYNRNDVALKIWDYIDRNIGDTLYTNFEDTNELDYTLTYDLVLKNTNNGKNNEYYALFEGRDSDFAAGIAPVKGNDDNTSLFIKDSVDFNINVTNLLKTDTAVSIRYDVRDYYGAVIEAGEFDNQGVEAGEELNRNVSVDAVRHGYGMYFLNLLVQSGRYTHREYYPFALLDDYKYKHNATSPFGINQVLGNSTVPYSDSYSLCNKVGVAVTRGGFIGRSYTDKDPYAASHKYLDLVAKKGIRIIAHGTSEETLKEFGDYFTDCMSGNEPNLPSIFGIKTVEECFDEYAENSLYKLAPLAKKYGKNLVLCGISAGQPEWYDMIKQKGAWDMLDKISLHVYGIPYSPECPEMLDNIWSTEGGLIRNRDALERNGKKPFQVNEMGYHTARPASCVCLRTQADYNIRSYILCVAYGAESVGAYCFYDFSNAGFGTLLSDMEYHFGNFYMPDYFGRILPKPVSVAYANMTRILESVKTVKESEKYSKDSVRAFFADTADNGDVMIAWSNCAPLPNDSYKFENAYENPGERKPTMPWQDQWNGSEYIFVKSDKKEVTVIDLMGHKTVYPVGRNHARIKLTGSPVFILGATKE